MCKILFVLVKILLNRINMIEISRQYYLSTNYLLAFKSNPRSKHLCLQKNQVRLELRYNNHKLREQKGVASSFYKKSVNKTYIVTISKP